MRVCMLAPMLSWYFWRLHSEINITQLHATINHPIPLSKCNSNTFWMSGDAEVLLRHPLLSTVAALTVIKLSVTSEK